MPQHFKGLSEDLWCNPLGMHPESWFWKVDAHPYPIFLEVSPGGGGDGLMTAAGFLRPAAVAHLMGKFY